jgi:hypothetical protein
MRINVRLNKESTASIVADESRYKWGYASFHRGERVAHKMTAQDVADLQRRINCLVLGWTEAADRIVTAFNDRGLFVVDILTPGNPVPVESLLEKKVVASNPFPPHSFAAKEWERGFNAAFTNNAARLRVLKRKAQHASRRPSHTGVPHPGKGKRPYGPRKSKPTT